MKKIDLLLLKILGKVDLHFLNGLLCGMVIGAVIITLAMLVGANIAGGLI